MSEKEKFKFKQSESEEGGLRFRHWTLGDHVISVYQVGSEGQKRVTELHISGKSALATGEEDEFIDAYIQALTEARNLFRQWRADVEK